MTLQEKIEQMVERIRAVWGAATVIGFIAVAYTCPLWMLIPFVVGAVGIYWAAMWMAGIIIHFMVEDGEIADDRPKEVAVPGETESGFKKEDVEKVGLSLGDVVGTSEAIGRFMDKPMFDWIDVLEDVKSSKVSRFMYDKITMKDRAGNLLLPTEEGFACYNGVTYKRQPA